MPWTTTSAKRFTKKAKSRKRQRQWMTVANKSLARGATEASAIRQANAAVKKAVISRRRRTRRR